MGRFSDWSPADQSGDPAPGDAFGVRGLASRWDGVASVAADVQATLEQVRSASSSGVWVGEAGDAFRDRLGDFPNQIWQVRDSFSQARDALNWWASMMESHQSTADQGLAAAVAAQADLVSAQASLVSAQSAQQSAQAAYSRQNRVFQQWGSAPAGQVPAGLCVPSGSVVRSLFRQQQDAAGRVGAASAQVGDAQSRLDAARRLVASAKQSYQEDAHTTAGRLQAATEHAIPADSWWEKLTNSDAWKVLVTVATVVVVVAAVAGLFLSGPAGWIAAGIAFGAGALLTADDVAEYAKGDMSTGQFLLALGLNFIPGGAIAKGGKALAKGVGAIARGAGRVASASGRVGQVATHAADTVVSGSKKAWSVAQRAGDRVSTASQRVWDGAKRSVRTDPIYQGVLASGKRAIDNVTELLARASGRPSLAHAGAGVERSTTRITGDLRHGAHTRQATTPDTGTGTSHGAGRGADTGSGRHSEVGGSEAGSPTSHGDSAASPHSDAPRSDASQTSTPDAAHAQTLDAAHTPDAAHAPDTPHAGDAPAGRQDTHESTPSHSDTDGHGGDASAPEQTHPDSPGPHGDTPGDSGRPSGDGPSGDGSSDGGPGDSTGRPDGDGAGGDGPGGSGRVEAVASNPTGQSWESYAAEHADDGLSTSQLKGQFGEAQTDAYMAEQGYTKVSVDKPTTTPGIDGIYEKDGHFVIVEAKYNTAHLGHTKNSGMQMSDDWLNGTVRQNHESTRIEDAFGDDVFGRERFLDQFEAGTVDRVVSRVDVDGVVELNTIEGAGAVAREVKHSTVLL